MKTFGMLLLSVALVVGMVSADICTGTECGDGPVFAYFTSEDCTGTPTFSKLTLKNESCIDSRQTFVTATGITGKYFQTEDCDESIGFWTETFVFGVCFSRSALSRDAEISANGRHQTQMKRATAGTLASGSMVVISNVNAALPAPQLAFRYDASNPWTNTDTEMCTSTYNCTLPDGTPARYYEYVYGLTGCISLGHSEVQPHFQPGPCYNHYNASYARQSCTGPNSDQIGYYNNPSCSGMPYYYETTLELCGPSNRYTGHCTAPIEPPIGAPSAPAPTGNASSLYTSVMAIFVAMIALFAL